MGSSALERLLASGDIVAAGNEIFLLDERADAITREILLSVRRSFITQFDRGDIKDLIQPMDDATDMMHETVTTVTLFEQRSFEPLMQEMGTVIVEAAILTAQAIPLLNRASANSQRLNELTEEVMRVDEPTNYTTAA